MKKILTLTLLLMLSMAAQSQGIYTKVTKYDKFDDVEWEKNIKTLISKSDSTIVIETKGSKPEEYRYKDIFPLAEHDGNRDNLVNIVADVWGYESQYIVFSEKNIEEFKKDYEENLGAEADSLSEDALKMALGLMVIKQIKNLPTITFRTISRYDFTFEYKTDMVWIKFKDGSRIIYSK